MIEKNRVEKFSPALFFRVIVIVPDNIAEEERVGYAEDIAREVVRTDERYSCMRLSMGEAYAHRSPFFGRQHRYEVAVIYRWG